MYITGAPREQLNFFEEKLDELVSPDNPVRFIDAFIDNLDLVKLGFKVPSLDIATGRPPYHPTLLLKIYTYGYLNRLRSSRKLETECNRNIELIWLTCRLAPDFKTIADFRKDNKKAIKAIFREFLVLCYKLDLLSFEHAAVDGTKMRAKNHLDNIYRRKNIDNISEKIQKKIDEYLEELDSNDMTEGSNHESTIKQLLERISKLKKNRDKVDIIKGVFNDNPELEIFFANDVDSRYMQDNKRVNAGYNCQAVVDDKYKLIVANDTTNESNDLHQLNNMLDEVVDVKNELNNENVTVVTADAGYFDEREVIVAEAREDFELYISHPRDSEKQKTKKEVKKGKVPSPDFEKDAFTYDEINDVFKCPMGEELKREGSGYIDKATGTRKYKYNCKKCNECEKRNLCTNDKEGRSVKVTEFFMQVQKFREKCNSNKGKKILAKRKSTVEHPFGTIKHNWGYRYFMQKGNEAAATEFSFISFIYNLRRVLNIVDYSTLMSALKT